MTTTLKKKVAERRFYRFYVLLSSILFLFSLTSCTVTLQVTPSDKLQELLIHYQNDSVYSAIYNYHITNNN